MLVLFYFEIEGTKEGFRQRCSCPRLRTYLFFSFVGSLSIKFLVTPFLRQSNLPLFAPFLCKVGTWTLPHFCVKHKKPNEDWKSFAKAHLKKERNKCPIYSDWSRRRADERFGRLSAQKWFFPHTTPFMRNTFSRSRNPNIS